MDNETVHQIVNLYERHRLLWDSKHPEYYNKNRREDLWREISVAVNVPVKELKRKMTSLLGSYRREKSREKKSQVTGSGEGDVYKSKWFAFTWFQFLSNKDIPNDTMDTMDNDITQCGSDETREESTNEEPITEEPIPTTSYQGDSSAQTTLSTATSVSQSIKKKRRTYALNDKPQNDMLLEAYSIFKKTSATPDHYETFGNHVASELRKYDSQTLPHVKRAILEILFRADIGEFTPTHNVPNNSGGYYSTSGASSSSHHSNHSSTATPPPPTSSSMALAETSNPPLQGDSLLQHYISNVISEEI